MSDEAGASPIDEEKADIDDELDSLESKGAEMEDELEEHEDSEAEVDVPDPADSDEPG